MALALNEEQRLLKDTAADFLKKNSPMEQFRHLRDTKDDLGYNQELWESQIELGWTSIALSEQYGGLDFGYQGLGLVMEELGRSLAPSPLFSTVCLCAPIISLMGNEVQKETYLTQIATGDLKVALALEETRHHNPCNISVSAEKTAEGYILNGKKVFVIDGHFSDYLIVVARTKGEQQDKSGISLFLVDRNTSGIDIVRTTMLDGHNAANVSFENVAIPSEALLGEEDNGFEKLDMGLDYGRILLSAYLYGLSQEVFDRTLSYLKEREQFDAKIGSFQALKHRASKMYIKLEMAKSTVLSSLTELDNGGNNLAVSSSLTKSFLNEISTLIANEGIQMHGGIGMTDEFDIGLFFKRIKVCVVALGDEVYHKDRYAVLKGY